MKLAIVLAAVTGLACQISPVISDPAMGNGSGSYADCRRAARAYCEDARGIRDDEEMRRCVAKATYECVSGLRD